MIGTRHAVIGEAAGQQLAVGVVDDMLVERLAHALHHAAMDLALDNGRVDYPAHVIGDDIAHHFCDAGRLIHFRSEEHTSELQSLMRISYAVFCLKKKKILLTTNTLKPL